MLARNHKSQTSDPLVTVCVTTYNLEQFIVQTIESLLSQVFDHPYEIIFHDDASTDKTSEILREYEKRHPGKIRVVLQEKNLYQEQGVGLGQIFADHIFPLARGKYIALCDGDDYWTDPLKLQKQLACLRDNKGSVACVTNATLLYEDKNESRSYHSNKLQGPLDQKRIMLDAGGIYPTSSLFFDKDELYKSTVYKNLREFSDWLAGDSILLYSLSEVGDIYYIDQVMSVYRRWEGGIFSSIKLNPEKHALRQRKQLEGLLRLRTFINSNRKNLLEKKISKETLTVIRHSNDKDRFKYLKYLTWKEWVKLLLGIRG